MRMLSTLPKSHIPLQDLIPGRSKKVIITGRSKKVIADPNVRWSSGENWRGVIAEFYQFEKVDTPEFQTVNHNIVLHLSAPADIEIKSNGRSDQRARAPGDLSIFPAATVCEVRSREPHEILVVSVSQQILAQSAFELLNASSLELHPHAYQRDTQLELICRALKVEAESNYLSGPLYGESLALAVGSRLLRRYSTHGSSACRTGGLSPQALRRVFDFIEDNLAEPLRMSSLAEIACLSQFRFAHNFKAAAGLPPHQYVMRARIERAKKMLRETNLSLVEVALAVGLHGSSRFNILFKREMGVSPGTFRSSFR